MPDPNLIRSARSGDPAAWEAILDEHYQPVFRLAYLIVGDPDDADDVAQEAFIRAHRYFRRYDETRPLRPWLLSIAANLARNRRRSLGRYYAAMRRLFIQRKTETKPDIEARTAAQLESHRLWQAVRQLSADDQDVIYLRFFLEIPVKEAAETLEVAPGTVKSRLSRALDRLKTLIIEEYPDLQAEFIP